MKMKRPPITADDLRKLGPDALEESLKKLSKTQLEEIRYKWEFWARDNQIEPDGDWYVWFLNCGRSYGKTRTGAEWVRHRVKCGDRRIAGVTATNSDIEKVMIKGDSGLLSVCSPNDKTYRGAKIGKPDWSPTKRTLTWANGAIMECFSAEEPERLRGPQFHSFWADELAAWNKDEETWDMLQFTMRLGKKPRGIVTTTPKPTKLVKNLLKRPDFYITTGSTFENTSLPDSFINQMKQQYEGTRLGAQELYAVLAQEAAGALWSQALLDTCLDTDITDPVKFATDNLVRVVVAVDPATDDKVESDMTGIVVAGVDVNGTGYVLEDATGRYSPQKWAQKAVELYYKYGADRIVAERNQGGAMVKDTLLNEDSTIPLRMVFASRGKMARAEPVAAMYERGKVKHAPGLGELEQQMVTWEPLGKMGSPDRLDAMVWALTDLMLKGRINPEIQILYSKQ